MRVQSISSLSVLFPGIATLFVVAVSGCDSSSETKSVQVSPEFQKKTEDYLKNYQQQMYDQHKAKPGAKKK
jgi:hypothetical protein